MRRGEGIGPEEGERERERGERVATVNKLLLLLLFDDCNAEKREWRRESSGKGKVHEERGVQEERGRRDGGGRGIDLYVAFYDCIKL